jgi:AsmA protein
MRKFLIVIGIVVIICAGALFAIFNLDRIVKANKDYFLASVEEKTGRQVEFEDISIAVWGGLGVRVKDVSATEDPAFSQQNFIEAEELYLKVAIFPLFKKQLDVKKVVLRKPVIRIIRDEAGRFNFDSMRPAAGGERSSGTAETGGRTGASYALFVAFADISNGEIIFIDEKEDAEVRLSRVDFAVQDVSMDKPFNARLEAAFLSGENGGKRNILLQGRIGPVGENPEPSAIPIELDATIDPLSTSEAGRLKSIAKLLPPDLVLSGPLHAKFHAVGNLSSLKMKSDIELVDCDITLGERFHKPAEVPCRLAAEGRLSESAIHIEQSDVILHQIDLAGSGDISLREPRTIKLALRSQEVKLSGWESLLPRLEPYHLSGEMALHLDLDGQLGSGMLPAGRASVVFADISMHPPRAVKPLQNIDGEALLTLAGKKIFVDSLLLHGLGGVIRAVGRFDLSKKPMRFAFDSKVRGIELAQLLYSTPAGAKEHAEGKINLDLLFGGQGSKWGDIRQSIDGQGTLEILQGVILDVNIIHFLFGDIGEQYGSSNYISDQLRTRYPQVFTANKTVFKEIDGQIRIEKGRITMPHLSLGTEDYTIAGIGSIQLDRRVESNASIVLSPQLSRDVIDQISIASLITNENGQVHIPFTLFGILPSVVVKPELAMQIKPPPIETEIDRLKNKLKDRFFPKKK